VLVPFEGSSHDVFSSHIHDLDGWSVNTITSEDYDFSHNGITSGYSDVEYSTVTFLGSLYSNWSIREYNFSSPNYYAQAALSQTFRIGKRCAVGTFVWLGLQGAITKATDWDPDDPVWVIQSRHNHVLAYCDTGGYGTNPFLDKTNNTTISDTIKEMIDKFYEEDPGGAVLEFNTDVRWVSGPTGSYSSVSSSSISSSSLSSSSESSSAESKSSSSESSNSSSSSSESIP
jgi:hypothetical protein